MSSEAAAPNVRYALKSTDGILCVGHFRRDVDDVDMNGISSRLERAAARRADLMNVEPFELERIPRERVKVRRRHVALRRARILAMIAHL